MIYAPFNFQYMYSPGGIITMANDQSSAHIA